MSNVGSQQLWTPGTRVFFQRDPVGGVVQPTIDLGTCDTVSPQFDPTKITLEDGDGGILVPIDEKVVRNAETYELTIYNFHPEITALMWASDRPVAYGQAGGAYTDVKHLAHNGHLVKLLDRNYDAATTPQFQYGMASITGVYSAVSSGGDEFVLGTDYEVVSLERGIIRILPGTSFIADGTPEVIYVTGTTRAISGKRRITPASAVGAIKGNCCIIWAGENLARQVARTCRVSISPLTPTIQIEDYSQIQLSLSVIHDLTEDEPAGRVEYWVGDLPSVLP